MSNDLVITACPPFSDYPEAPQDQSETELFDCPKCKEKMWLSQKKKGILMFASCLNKKILLCCYHCLTKMAQDDPYFFCDSTMMRL